MSSRSTTDTARQSPVVWLMPLGTIVQYFLPRWVVVIIAKMLAPVLWQIDRRRRAALESNFRHIIGSSLAPNQLRTLGQRAFRHLLESTFDTLRIPVLRRRVRGLAEFDRSLLERSSRRGAIVVTAHIANWDLAGAIIAAHGFETSAVVETIPGGWTRTFDRYRRATGLQTIPLWSTPLLRQALLNRRVVALVADRDITGNGIICPAFDAQRSFPKGPAWCALRYRLPIIIGIISFQHRRGRPPYRIETELLDFCPSGQLGNDIEALTGLIAERLNSAIAQFPDQWLVFSPDWR